MAIKRIAYKEEPVLHVHRYIVQIIKNGKTRFKYCVNLKEVQQEKNKAAKGSVIEVYKAQHNFHQAFYKEE